MSAQKAGQSFASTLPYHSACALAAPNTSDHNRRGTADLLDKSLELGEVWSSETCGSIPAFCCFPTRFGVLSNSVRSLSNVIEGIWILVEKWVHEAEGLLAT